MTEREPGMSPGGPEGWRSFIASNTGKVFQYLRHAVGKLLELRPPRSVLRALDEFNRSRTEPLQWQDIETDMLSRINFGERMDATVSVAEVLEEERRQNPENPQILHTRAVNARIKGEYMHGEIIRQEKSILAMLHDNFGWLTDKLQPAEWQELVKHLRVKHHSLRRRNETVSQDENP